MSTFGIFSLAESKLDLPLTDEFKKAKIQNLLTQLFLNNENINTLKRNFDQEIEDGLRTDKPPNVVDLSKMTMNLTYFTEFFDGTENGTFVVMNLTAQHLILALATVQPGFEVKAVRKWFVIDESIRQSPYMKIFEFLCNCLLLFFTENRLLGELQTLGFCTDLPMTQLDINTAFINYFTMSASEFPLNEYHIRQCFETVLVQENFKEIKIDLIAIMSNNMNYLVYSSYVFGPIDIFLNIDDDCGLIYKEELKKIPNWKSAPYGTQHVFIDTQLKYFGKSGILNFLATEFDWSLICNTQGDKECRLQKFLTEINMLELIRHILVALHHELVYCREGNIGDLHKFNGITLKDLMKFMNTEEEEAANVLLPGGTTGVTLDNVLIAKYVCKLVLIRAALLTSICLSRIFLRSRKNDFTVAMKCSLLDQYLDFETDIRNFMADLAPEKKFQIFQVKGDVCVEGASLATSIIKRKKKRYA